jgi:hypothetical protein
VDPGPGDDAARRRAVLARVVVAADLHPLDHGVEVGVVEHQHRGLAAQLEVDAGERVGRGPQDGLAGRHLARERHHGHVRVGDQRGADRLALAGDDVEHAGREHVL